MLLWNFQSDEFLQERIFNVKLFLSFSFLQGLVLGCSIRRITICVIGKALFGNREFHTAKANILKFPLEGGIEASLDTISKGILAIGIIGGIIALVGVLITASSGELPPAGIVSGIAFGVLMILQGWVFSVLMGAAAEIIRLLKKQCGLKFGGRISEPKEIKPQCSNCFSDIKNDKECKQCGAIFET